MAKTWRTFIALELPTQVEHGLQILQDELKQVVPQRAARWVRSDRIHLTLKFLGDVEVEKIETIKSTLDNVATSHKAFTLQLEGLGCFPNVKRPRVLWVGIGDSIKALKRVQEQVEAQMVELGFKAEGRRFTPHLTLARSNQKASRQEMVRLGAVAEEQHWIEEVGEIGGWTVDRLSLMRSQLKPDGAVYTQIHKANLQHE